MLPDPVEATLLVIHALEGLGVPYVIGGSFASAMHGVPRSTVDSDIVAELTMAHVGPLTQALTPAFYVDEGAVRMAVARRSSFNVIHLATSFKVDVFASRGRDFERSEFQRCSEHLICEGSDQKVFVATPEDVLLAKMEWYRSGGEVSDRQWRDILGLLGAQRGRLDLRYLECYAKGLGVTDLLHRAVSQAGGDPSGLS